MGIIVFETKSNCQTQENVTLKIFNLKGQLVNTLMNSPVSPGDYQLLWNGKNYQNKNVTSGIYFYKFSTEEITQTRKMLLIK